jgi:hypothetical protein
LASTRVSGTAGSTTPRVDIPYTLFKQQVEAANVAVITADADQIQGMFKRPVSYTPPSTGQAVRSHIATVQPTFSDSASKPCSNSKVWW